jgi:hypothetical protein
MIDGISKFGQLFLAQWFVRCACVSMRRMHDIIKKKGLFSRENLVALWVKMRTRLK